MRIDLDPTETEKYLITPRRLTVKSYSMCKKNGGPQLLFRRIVAFAKCFRPIVRPAATQIFVM